MRGETKRSTKNVMRFGSDSAGRSTLELLTAGGESILLGYPCAMRANQDGRNPSLDVRLVSAIPLAVPSGETMRDVELHMSDATTIELEKAREEGRKQERERMLKILRRQ